MLLIIKACDKSTLQTGTAQFHFMGPKPFNNEFAWHSGTPSF